MWQWLKILALGKVVLLTQGPIDIGNDWRRLTPPVPLTALDDGAHIDVFMNPMAALPGSADAKRAAMKERFPARCVNARMQSDDDKRVSFLNTEERVTAEGAYLVLHPTGPFPKRQVYSRIWVRASCPLRNVMVRWKNNGEEAAE